MPHLERFYNIGHLVSTLLKSIELPNKKNYDLRNLTDEQATQIILKVKEFFESRFNDWCDGTYDVMRCCFVDGSCSWLLDPPTDLNNDEVEKLIDDCYDSLGEKILKQRGVNENQN